jgi:hypothetical protein
VYNFFISIWREWLRLGVPPPPYLFGCALAVYYFISADYCHIVKTYKKKMGLKTYRHALANKLVLSEACTCNKYMKTILSSFPGTGQDVRGRVLSVSRKIRFRMPKCLSLFQVKQFDISNKAYEHYDLTMAENVSLGINQP